MNMKHTPGPWIRKGENVWNEVEMMYHAAPNFDTINPSQTLIANARLIAASPELLFVLQNLLAALAAYDPDTGKGERRVNGIVESARAAIAKATGESA